MSDDSQLVLPSSFLALFIEPGRIKPSAPRAHILARYELCEDLATMLTDHARNKLWELGVTETDVLERIHRGLLATGDDAQAVQPVQPAEAAWVTRRLAELLDWHCPALEPETKADPGG